MPPLWSAQLTHLSRKAGVVRSVCLWEGRDSEQDVYGCVHSHVTVCFLPRHLLQGKYGQASCGLPLAVVPTYTNPTQRRSVSHLLLLTFPLFTAHCRDTPFDSAAHTWPSASFCSAVLLLKIASACPGSTASLHKLWGGWGWRRGVRRGVKREGSEEGVPRKEREGGWWGGPMDNHSMIFE